MPQPNYCTPSVAFRVEEIPVRIAKPFVEANHYSRNLPAGKNVCFGAFLDGQLYAVAIYGIGVNMHPHAFLGRMTGLGSRVTKFNLLELKRLARIGKRGAAKIPLTAFLAECHRTLRARGIRFIISFSDPEHSHDGGIYRAANFFFLGSTARETHYRDVNGDFVHRRIPYRYAQRYGLASYKHAATLLDLTEHKTPQKSRWFMPLFRNDFRRVSKYVASEYDAIAA
jgi:hypothetical protein